MEKWLNTRFESSSTQTPQFKKFATAFKKEVKSILGSEYNVKLDSGHFYISGFVEKNGKYVYISVSDVRYFNNEWYNHIMVRTAKNDKDYTGGNNNYCSLNNLKVLVDKLSQ